MGVVHSLGVWSLVMLVVMAMASGMISGAQIGTATEDTATPNSEFENQATQQGGSSIRFGNQQSDGETVTVRSAALPEGGFIVIHEEIRTEATPPRSSPSPSLPATTLQRRSPTTTAEGSRTSGHVSVVPVDTESIIGVSDYLEPGPYRDVTIELFDVPGKEFDRSRLTESQDVASAELHRDTNGNERFDFLTSERNVDSPYYVPYGVSGDTVLQKGPAIDIAVIAIGESIRAARGIGPTSTGTAMAAGAGGAGAGSAQAETPIRTPPSADSSPANTDNTGKSGETGPGFGILVAVIALLSGLGLTRRE